MNNTYTSSSTVLVIKMSYLKRPFELFECECSSIDWGDNSTDSTLSHLYTKEGIYYIEIKDNTKLMVNNVRKVSDTNYDIIGILQLSDKIETYNCMFHRCHSIRSVDLTIPKTVTSIERMFANCSCLRQIRLKFEENNMEICNSICSYCESLIYAKIDFGKGIKNYWSIFSGCERLNNVILAISEGVEMSISLIYDCPHVRYIDILFKTIPSKSFFILNNNGYYDEPNLNFSFDMDKITPDEAHEFLEKYFTKKWY